jgi:TRAP-type transport system small permease protein
MRRLKKSWVQTTLNVFKTFGKSMSSNPTSINSPLQSGWIATTLKLAKKHIVAADRWLMTAIHWLLIILLGAMAVIIFSNVMLRYVSGSSIVWAEEVARYCMIWLTFLGAGPVLRMGGHIAIENLQDAMPTVLAQWTRAVVLLLMIGLGLGMVTMGLAYVQRSQFQMTASTQIPFSYIYAAIPIGGLILLWSSLAIAVSYVKDRLFEADASDLHGEGVQV